MKITGAVGLNGRVYRAGDEDALTAAANDAGVDLNDARFAGAIGGVEAAEADAGTDWGAMDKDDLAAEAESRGLTVTRADGKDGDPLKSDLVKALEAAE